MDVGLIFEDLAARCRDLAKDLDTIEGRESYHWLAYDLRHAAVRLSPAGGGQD